jgi:transposase
MHQRILEELQAVGLTRNEALGYLALLEDDSGEGLTGYEVAARSGIPRSAVYTVLRQLEESGAAFAQGEAPSRYVATDPTRLVAQMRRSSTSRLDALAEALDQLPSRTRPEPIWTLSRYDQILKRIEAMLRTAEHSIYLSLWSREVELLMPVLRELSCHPLHRVLHSPDALSLSPPGFSLWVDDVSGDEGKAGWSHKALVVVDRREALIGGIEPAADNQAVVTSNPSLVDVATNHIILDITLLSRKLGRDPIQDVSPMMRPHLKSL